ncbi:Hpt domain-containing protein [Vibrio tapetis subsp. quintayensis]|uniref:Hpt domain-containing protein n=1 Tax=Vibrio tapetis TaxID=52443 RepID=UPI0025B592C4|nr:Hpt domain-containing protein [Vibrio tapetis]MDN3679254.1 Hpt domain-containing protein [Vibrio tapetis subsp. quintayensis]
MIDHSINATHSNDEQVSPLESVSGLNVSEALARFGGNNSIYHQLLSQWIESEVDFEVRMTSAMLQQDYPSAIMCLHTLKGTSANLGAMGISDKARELESLLKANPHGERVIEKLAQLTSDLSTFFEQLHAVIQTEQTPQTKLSQRRHNTCTVSTFNCLSDNHTGQVKQVLTELLYFLDNYDTSAIEYAERHYTELDQALGGQKFEVCYKSIHQCDFEVAGKILRQLWPELEQIKRG